jgi:hypothetical protein
MRIHSTVSRLYAMCPNHFPARVVGLMAVMELVGRLPDELLPGRAEDYSKYIAAVAAIRDRVEKWRSGLDTGYPMQGLREYDGKNPILILRDVLSSCPDESPSSASSDLSFIHDSDLRNDLRQDLSAVNMALAQGEWKSSTVLGGSLCEALLLWKLQEEPLPNVSAAAVRLTAAKVFDKPSGSLEKWSLHQYTEVASELGFIKKDTAIQVRQAKDFRNLVHPGKAMRLGQKCDRGTAHAVVAAIEFIIRDLTP